MLGYSRFDYGNRAGIARIFRLLDELNLPATLSVNVAAIDRLVEPTEEAVSRGWEILSHGIYNTRFFSGISEAVERAAIEHCVAVISRRTGSAPRGWMGPLGTSSERTLDLLPEYGFTYTTDLFHEDEPFPVWVRSGRLISVPYTQETNDWSVFEVYGQTAEEFRQTITDQFDCLYRESEDSGRVMCVSLHPYIVGHPHRLRELQWALEYIQGHSRVWYATGSEIADWYYEHYYTQAVAALHAQG